MLERIGNVEVMSVFLFGYNQHLDYLINYLVDNNWDDYRKYEFSTKFKEKFSYFLEDFRKAEDVKNEILDFYNNPEKYFTYDENTGQITYNHTSKIKDYLMDFIRDMNQTYLSFFQHFVDQLDLDKNDLHKEYILDKSTKSDDLYNYLIGEDDAQKKKHFKIHLNSITDIFQDLKTKRNFGIEHNPERRKGLVDGRFEIGRTPNGAFAWASTPKTDFRGKKTDIKNYVEFIFYTTMLNFQHVIALFTNKLLQDFHEKENQSNLPGSALFYDINFLKSLYKKEDFDEITKHLRLLSDKQIYVFGSFHGNQFATMSTNGIMNPDIKYKNHLQINVTDEEKNEMIKGNLKTLVKISNKTLRNLKKGDRLLINKRIPTIILDSNEYKSLEEMLQEEKHKNVFLSDKPYMNTHTFFRDKIDQTKESKYGLIVFKLEIRNY